MPAILARLLGVRPRRDACAGGRGGRRARREWSGQRRGEPALPYPPGFDASVGGCEEEDADFEEAAPVLRYRCEAVHGMEDEQRDSRSLIPRHTQRARKIRGESAEERRMRRMWEKQQQAMGAQVQKQTKASMLYAKRQILEATSTPDLLEKAESLIEQDWLGKIEEMPGSMYFIGAFGDLTHGEPMCSSLNGLKAAARLVGCIVIACIQMIGPPAVFFGAIFGWGLKRSKFYHWDVWKFDNCLYDWQHVKLTKFLGLFFTLLFVLNGLFVILDGKQAWFKIYNIFQYLKRNTPNFAISGQGFLYLGAFVNCWTILWCCLSSYVIVGASDSPKDILFDSLGILFVYNLDDIGGELGFVDEDDWPGLRLGWIHTEMVKKDWRPGDEEEPGEEPEAPLPCVKGCGRLAAPGTAPSGRPFDTCCKGCGLGEAHDPDCKPTAVRSSAADLGDDPRTDGSGYIGGETTDWEIGGWVAFYGYSFTIVALCFLAVVLPLMSAVTPFLLIVPDD